MANNPEPCRVTKQRFDEINTAKYCRDLSRQEKIDYLTYQFYKSLGLNPDFANPVTFNEKLNWLKVFYSNPLQTLCADKVTFPNFVKARLPELSSHCVKPVGIYRSPEELTVDEYSHFPENFVLKSNFGSGAQLFANKSASIVHLQSHIKNFLEPLANHYYSFLEPSYKDISGAVVCEPLLDYKYKIEFFCFDGEPFVYWIIVNDKKKDMRLNIYSLDGKRLAARRPQYPNFNMDPRPAYFDDLVQAARILSAGFPHVRVDFYATRNSWLFSELTFFTGAGFTPFTSHDFDVQLGDKLKLPKADAICA